MNHNRLITSLKQQRDTLVIEPIHATVEPVRAYAEQIARIKGELFSVVELPEGATAYSMGYRFACIPTSDLDHFLPGGARLVE